MRKLLKRMALTAFAFYGWMSLVLTLVLIIAFSLPLENSFVMGLGILCAIPFMFYPFWWMIVSFVAGIIVMIVWRKLKNER